MKENQQRSVESNLETRSEALKRQALTWITLLTSGKATTDDAKALVRWRERSPAHEAAFKEQVKLWRDVGYAVQMEAQPRAFYSRRWFLTAGGIAAATSGLAIMTSPFIFSPISDYSTKVGEQKKFTLPDGSKVHLDGGSAFSVKFSDGERGLNLTAGAAVFDIVDDARPFLVEAGPGRVKTSDASVAVSIGTGDVSVQCLSKTVEVHCLERRDIRQGQQVSYTEMGVTTPTVFDISTAAAWRVGMLIFQEKQLSDIVFDLNRHRPGRIIVARPNLGKIRVSGVFHLDRPDEIVLQLADTLDVRQVNLIGGIVVLI